MDRLFDLIRSAGGADPLSDERVLEALLDVEVALARVQARLGLIPESAAEAIARAADPTAFDADRIGTDAVTAATPVIPLVRALTEQTRAVDPAAAGFVHWGATSQDIADTALARCLARAHRQLASMHRALIDHLRQLSDRHAGSLMLGRTLLQPGPPTTFGLKASGWYAACVRGWARVDESASTAFMLQFGGAVGTLASLGDDGPRVAEALAGELGLPCPDAPWHAHRDRLVAAMASHGVYVGTLGKIARDISLLMQAEVGEVAEPGGGSSTMPHKRNPSGCAVVLSAATRVPGLVATLLSAMPQEHERGVGGLQAEWPTVAAVVRATQGALRTLVGVIGGLQVDVTRMRQNLEATGGSVLAERVMMRLAISVGRDEAYRVVKAAFGESRRTGSSFAEALAESPEMRAHVPASEIAEVMDPERYLGVAEVLRRRLLDAAGMP